MGEKFWVKFITITLLGIVNYQQPDIFNKYVKIVIFFGTISFLMAVSDMYFARF